MARSPLRYVRGSKILECEAIIFVIKYLCYKIYAPATMSNQVYANERQKFYPCPGINTFDMAANQGIGGGNTATVSFANAVLTQAADQVSVAAGTLTFHQEGIYSVKIRIGVVHLASPTTVDPDVRAKMRVVCVGAANGASLCEVENRFPARGGANGSDNRVFELDYTGYFAKESAVFCELTNNDSGNQVDVLQSESAIIVCKLI